MAKAQDYGVFTPETWSPRVTAYFKEKLVLAQFHLDRSVDVEPGGDTVHLPKRSQRFTVSSIDTTSGEVSATDVSDTSSTLNLNTWEGASFFVSDYQGKQMHRQYNEIEEYGRDMAFDVAKSFDDVLWTYTAASNISDSVGDSATDLLSTSLEKAISIAESNSTPLESLSWFFHPYAYWREVMNIQKYYDASQAGWAQGDAPMVGAMRAKGELYGAPVFVTSQVPGGTAGSEGGHRNTLMHPELTAFAIQTPEGDNQPYGGVRVSIKDGEHLRKKFIGDIIYGATNLRSDAGVRIISNN